MGKPSIYNGHVEAFYRMVVPHGEGLLECRVIDVNQRQLMGIGYFDDVRALVRACGMWNGKANIYAGRNPRPERLCTPSERNTISSRLRAARRDDIETVTMVSLDFDPVRPNGLPSTDEEEAEALGIAAVVGTRYDKAAFMASGNGAQLLIPVKPTSIADRQEWFEHKTKAWEAEVRHEVESMKEPGRPQVKLDSQYDLPRIVKVPGTLSVKGTPAPDRPHRMAYFIGTSDGPNDVLKQILEVEHAVADEGEPEQVRPPRVTPAASIPEFLWSLLQHDQRLRLTWEGQRNDFPKDDYSRSGYDMSLATQLARYGFTSQEILAVLLAFPHGRNTTGTPDYFARTIDEAVHPGHRARKRRGQG